MTWRIQMVFAAMIAVLGLYVLFNPVTIVSLVAGVIPWMLTGAGALYILSVFLRSRRSPLSMILPALIGSLLLYSGLSMKLGASASVGPVSLLFVFALLLLGSGAVKLLMALTIKRSRYFPLVLGSGVVSTVVGLMVLTNWSGLSVSFLGIVLAIELLADALVLASIALRDRDGEEVLEAAGLDPADEARKKAARAPEPKTSGGPDNRPEA